MAMNILHIDSSIQGELSISRKLSAAIVRRLHDTASGHQVTYRDLAATPLPQFSGSIAADVQASVGCDGQAAGEAAPICDALGEVLAADVIVIGAPMYNFSVPSQLKSWIDAITVPGKTFRYGPDGVTGLLGDKRVIVASTRGGFYGPDSPAAGNEHHESYLRSIFAFLGVTRFEVVRAEGLRISPEIAEGAIANALEQAAHLKAA